MDDERIPVADMQDGDARWLHTNGLTFCALGIVVRGDALTARARLDPPDDMPWTVSWTIPIRRVGADYTVELGGRWHPVSIVTEEEWRGSRPRD